MNKYTVGIPSVSAVLKTRSASGETSSVLVAKDDALTNLTISSYPADVVLESVTVKGFTLTAKAIPRGPSSRVFDGVPTFMWDTDGGEHFGLAEETVMIDKMLVEVPGETEDAPSTMTLIPVSAVKSFEGGTPVESESSSSESTEND